MAITYVGGLGDSGTGSGSLSFSSPSVANDLLIAFIERSFGDTNQSAPSGWTQFSFSPINDGSGSQFQAFWRRADNTATDDFAVTDGGNHFIAAGGIFRGASLATNPFDFVTSGSKTTASTSVTITGGTTVANDCLIISAFTTPRDSNQAPANTWENSSLTSISNFINQATNAGDGGSVSAAFGTKATAGAVSDTTVTITTSQTNAWCMIAIKPSVVLTAEPADLSNRIVAPFDLSDASWTNGNSTETVNSTAAPDGSITADTLVPTNQAVAIATRPFIRSTAIIGLSSGATYNLEAWVKPGGATRFGLAIIATFYAYFDLTGSGTASHVDTWANATINISSITKVGDWYWCRLNFTADVASQVFPFFYIPVGTSNSYSDAADPVIYDTSSTVYIWGASFVKGTAPSAWPFGSYQITANDAILTKTTVTSRRIIMIT